MFWAQQRIRDRRRQQNGTMFQYKKQGLGSCRELGEQRTQGKKVEEKESVIGPRTLPPVGGLSPPSPPIPTQCPPYSLNNLSKASVPSFTHLRAFSAP